MLFELSVIPTGDVHLSGVLAEVLKKIDASGVPYQFTPTGTCLEGDWDVAMSLMHECHQIARRRSPHVITTIRIDDDGETNKLSRNIRSVEEKAGHPLATQPASSDAHKTGLA
ncbi:MAG: MTH1187 family thiamine-binding protein [Planctomycetota bacterium]|nr:thiamine-binding protein [Planctomycetaceae bacterium]MDQ3329225.1 MTH1187 family thiamine-binding protein [Planctomycetota bacterium]